MAIKRYLQGIAIVALILLSTTLLAMAAPSLTDQNNNKTNNGSTSFTVNVSESVNFSATSNETVNMTWHWFLNGTDMNHNLSSYDVVFSGDTFVKVNVTNKSSGLTSNPRTWTVTIQTSSPLSPSKPYIVSWGNTKTNNSTQNIVINRSESITFNATANQTIDTWHWYLNGTIQSFTTNTSNYPFNIAGSHNVSVNATSNANGTSNTIIWSINVIDNDPPANITISSNSSGYNWITWIWTNPSSDFKLAMVYIDEIFKRNVTTNTYNTTLDSLILAPKTTHNISLRPVDFSDNIGNWTNGSASTIAQKPIITRKSQEPVFDTLGIETRTFVIEVDQISNVTWKIGDTSQPNPNKTISGLVNFTFKPSDKGSYNISVSANNENGTSNIISWNWTVRPTTFSTGNRIWDGSKPDEFSKTYTWTPMSFSGFYYNAKDDVGNENIQITVGSYDTRTISKSNLVYTTSPQQVTFTYSNFGQYQVIGFMADKYFAGYKNTTPPHPSSNVNEISAVGQGQLHKVLIDDDTKRTIAVGGTFALQEGYVLKATDIDLNARTMLLSLLKDGNEVDSTPLSADQTYVYRKRIGSVSDLPLIMVRFDSVFSGSELQVAFLKGLFQISENPTIISSGNTFRNMEIKEVGVNGIRMENSNAISLSKGSTNDVMGDVKILVANNDDSALRFALSVEKTGNYEVRSTVYRSDDKNPILEWTPYNFGMNIGQTSIGFYYDLDDGVGSEKLNLKNNVSGNIPDQELTYSTSPVEVKFSYTGFGKYNVIGFMADKYFAGYTSETKPLVTRPSTTFAGKSSLANGALLKVLIDDDTKRTIAVGGTIALKEGYVLKASDIDLNARVMLLTLLKDGSEVDTTPLAAGETYVYAKKVGSTDNLPLIMVRFETVFSGSELQVGFLKGIFQISDTPTMVTTSDQYGKMDVRTVADTGITMSNDGSISLDKNKNDVLMGNIRLKVADSDIKRFYFAVDVTPEMIVNQLVIDAPTKAMAGDTIKIKITAGGVGLNNATVDVGTDSATTDQNGNLNYTLPRTLKGNYSITASMTGYEKATQNIEIEKYVDYRLSLEAPSMSNQFETITIKVMYNGTAMSGANVNFDNTTVGTSDSNGEVTYQLQTSGTHSITASKTSYISVTRDIEIRAPYSEFKGLDINITPNPGFAGKPYLVKANITNIGTMSGSMQVDLVVNGTAVDNKTITLGAKEKVEINFTRIEPIAGNVTVEVMGQSILFEAKENPTNYLLIGAIITGIGAVIIYTLTSKGLLSLEILKEKFGLLADKFNNLFKR
jgi:S-layer protein (TIGR01567 family)